MRTAIYVYARDPESQMQFALSSDAVISKYVNPTTESMVENDNGRCVLTAGIYKVVSGTPPSIQLLPGNLADYDVVAVTDDKDPWPDPPAMFRAMFSDVSLAILRAFLPNATAAFGAAANDKRDP